MAQKVTVTPLSDITSIMVGTEANWFWEVETVYVDGVSTAFTWAEGVVDIPSYVSGTVLVEYTLYLLYDLPSQYFPKDPTDLGSDPVYWENRISNFISYATSIKSFETGLTEISVGNVAIQIDDDWLGLIQQVTIFSNRTVRIYRDNVISFKGISTRSSISNFVMTINVQKRITILDSECNWGDPAWLNRIDRTSNTAFYNGANVPDQYEGIAIPMLFGEQTPYELNRNGEVDLGDSNPGLFAAPISNKRPEVSLNVSRFCVRVIPTSTTSGILGRMPVYQTISSTPISVTMTGRGAPTFIKAAQANNAVITTKMIPGSVAIMERLAPGAISPCRYYNYSSTTGQFLLGVDDSTATFALYDTLQSCNEKVHAFPSQIPTASWTTPAVLSATLTPGGHRWLTVSGLTGIDLYATDLYMVLTEVSGSITAVETMQFALQSHGFTVDTASFTALATDLPYNALMQCGFGSTVPTLGQFIAEINRSLMTALVFPADNDVPYLVKIDPTEIPSQTIDESQINGLNWTNEYRDQAKNVIFRPAYMRNDQAKNDLYANITASRATLFGSQKTTEINHVLSSLPSTRFDEITEIYGSPETTIKFGLLDDDVEVELADVIQIDHSEFKNQILITNIEILPIGRSIQGRYLYVN